MNLILFEEEELSHDLAYDDPRSVHIERILGLGEGDVFAAGVIGGQKGEARLIARGAAGWKWIFLPNADGPPLRPLTLILGCPRPPVARRLLKDMSALGVREIRACATDLNEKSYLTAKLWREGLWRDAVIDGAMQAAGTHLTAVSTATGLERALDDLPAGTGVLRITLDNGPAAQDWPPRGRGWKEAVLAVGPERGWSDRERAVLEAAGFVLTGLGQRILRTETACAVGAGLVLAALGAFSG